MGIFCCCPCADYNESEMASLIAEIDLNSIAFVLYLLLAIGSAASPFNEFLRSKCFSDGYRWRGLNREDTIPILKTTGLTLAFCAGALGSIIEGNQSHAFYWIFVSLPVATVAFSISYSLWKARQARENR